MHRPRWAGVTFTGAATGCLAVALQGPVHQESPCWALTGGLSPHESGNGWFPGEAQAAALELAGSGARVRLTGLDAARTPAGTVLRVGNEPEINEAEIDEQQMYAQMPQTPVYAGLPSEARHPARLLTLALREAGRRRKPGRNTEVHRDVAGARRLLMALRLWTVKKTFMESLERHQYRHPT